MDATYSGFLRLVEEIEANSWWNSHFKQNARNPAKFEYAIDDDGERITEVPKEPFESLLLKVRRLTMEKSPENLSVIRTAIGAHNDNPHIQNLLDAWHQYWRLAFIKEPYLLQVDGKTEVMTAYRAYNAHINGRHFHSESKYNVILFGENTPNATADFNQFIQNQFHWTVANLCLAALGLRIFIVGGAEWQLSGHVAGTSDFVWCRNQIPQMKEQYKIFNDWIQEHGGCSDCRWK